MFNGTLDGDTQGQIEERPHGDFEVLAPDPAPFVAVGQSVFALGLEEHGGRGRQDVEQEEQERGKSIAQHPHGGSAHQLNAESRMRQHQGRPCHVKENKIDAGAAESPHRGDEERENRKRQQWVHCCNRSS